MAVEPVWLSAYGSTSVIGVACVLGTR